MAGGTAEGEKREKVRVESGCEETDVPSLP